MQRAPALSFPGNRGHCDLLIGRALRILGLAVPTAIRGTRVSAARTLADGRPSLALVARNVRLECLRACSSGPDTLKSQYASARRNRHATHDATRPARLCLVALSAMAKRLLGVASSR